MFDLSRSVVYHKYCGEDAVTASYGPYEMTVLPEMGGNLISFQDKERGFKFLRTPDDKDIDIIKHQKKFVFGMPVLFPPNRYDGGTFTLDGHRYRLPINELQRENHLHGLLHDIPWHVVDAGVSSNQAHIELQQTIDAHHPVYQYFPHCLTITIRYALSDEGLLQGVRVRNTGRTVLPCLLAFHTTFNVPFATGSAAEDYTFMATIGKRWELSERMLPTGEFQELSTEELKMSAEGVAPFFDMMDNHYTAAPEAGRNYMALTDHRVGVRLIYDVGLKYKHWMIFNNYGKGEFICPEPQTSVVNAPNLDLPRQESGIVMLAPGQTWSETSRIYIEDLTTEMG